MNWSQFATSSVFIPKSSHHFSKGEWTFMKNSYLVILLALYITGCVRQNHVNNLPSQKLLDTLLREAICQSPIPIIKDTINCLQCPRIYYINKNIQSYRVTGKSEYQQIFLDLHGNELDFDYLLSKRFSIDGNMIFTPKDTSFFRLQISAFKPFRLVETNNLKGKLIDSNQILAGRMAVKTHKMFMFNYVCFYPPLLNLSKNIAIIGVEDHHCFNEIVNDSFVDIYILKRVGNKWTLSAEIPWATP